MKKIRFWSIVLLMAVSLPLLYSCGGDDEDVSNNKEVYVPKDGDTFIAYEDGIKDDKYIGRYVFINGGTELKLLKAGREITGILQFVEYKGKQYPITCIGKSACGGKSSLTENVGLQYITIPQSVTTIEEYAFEGCHGIRLTIPNSVKIIGKGAFTRCNSLSDVNIPGSVSVIESQVFAFCTELAGVSISKGVKEIKEGAFMGCPQLYSVSIPNSVTSIGEQAFYNCPRLKIIEIPNSVTSIGDEAFYECHALTSITIPYGVTSIGKRVFWRCSALTSITIPNSVTSIGDEAFCMCSGLTSIKVLNTTPPSIAARAFSSYSATLIVPAGCKEAYQNADVWKNFTKIVEDDSAV